MSAIYFENNSLLNGIIRKLAYSKWSQTNKCWYLPLNQESYTKLYKALHGNVSLEITELKKYLESKKQSVPPVIIPVKNIKELQILPQQLKSNGLKMWAYVAAVNKHVLPAMQQHLKLKAYSPSTIRTYLNEMAQLLVAKKDIPADELTPELLKRYLVYCYEKLGLLSFALGHPDLDFE